MPTSHLMTGRYIPNFGLKYLHYPSVKFFFIQHLLPITNIFDKATHTWTSNSTYKRERESPRKLAKKLCLAQLTVENRHTPSGLPFCVFRDGSVNYFSNLTSSTSGNVELEVMPSTAHG